MNPKKQRIAIAEACGWRIYKSNGTTYYERPGGNVFDHELSPDALPEYPTDLNAMHEAEKMLEYPLDGRYLHELTAVCRRTNDLAFMATAAQRAEAFLRAIGKWENE